MLNALPSRTAAVVVGIDYYDYGDSWNLPGPAADALKCVDWLIGRGVEPQSIHLFLADKSKKHAEVVAWHATNPAVILGDATRADIVRFLDKGLQPENFDALILFWGGHGVMDDFVNHNYLFTTDAQSGLPYCIDVQNLLLALHGKRFEQMSEQVVIVDACANRYSDIREPVKPSPLNLVTGKLSDDIRQFQMFAASPGRFALNDSERRTGRFTEALFAELKAHTAEGWPDFAEAFDAAKSELKRLGLGEQEPYIITDSPERGRSFSGRIPGQSTEVDTLRALLAEQAATPESLYALYRQSLPKHTRPRPSTTPVEALLHDLKDCKLRAANMPSPLVEFAERAARQARGDKIREWVDDDAHVDPFARDSMRKSLDAEFRKNRPKATVFVELEGVPPSAMHWWLHTPDPAVCTGSATREIGSSAQDDLAAQLRTIMDEAESAVGHLFDLVIGLIVTDRQMFLEFEATQVRFDMAPRATPLNRRYPVVLHWRVRARAKKRESSKPLNAWRQALDTLMPRLERGGVAEVVWLEPRLHEDDPDSHLVAASKMLDEQGTGVLIGLGHPASCAAGTTPDELVGCLREGIPCFFWLSRPPLDEVEARKALCDAFSALRASDAPRQIGSRSRTAKDSDPLSSIRIVWDAPGHLPVTEGYEGAPTREAT